MLSGSEWFPRPSSSHSCATYSTKLGNTYNLVTGRYLRTFHFSPVSVKLMVCKGFISSVTRGSASTPSPEEWAAVPESRKRIWATLKYRNERPVLSAMEVVSKPSRRIFLDEVGVRRLASGHRAQFVKPLGMGEIAVVKTGDRQWMEAREAVRLNLGGEVICRAR